MFRGHVIVCAMMVSLWGAVVAGGLSNPFIKVSTHSAAWFDVTSTDVGLSESANSYYFKLYASGDCPGGTVIRSQEVSSGGPYTFSVGQQYKYAGTSAYFMITTVLNEPAAEYSILVAPQNNGSDIFALVPPDASTLCFDVDCTANNTCVYSGAAKNVKLV